MNEEYTYHGGQLIPSNTLPEMNENEEWDEWITRVGFCPNTSNMLGEPTYGGSITIYENKTNKSFLADVEMISTCRSVILPDFPALMQFLKEYAPVMLLASIQGTQEEMYKMMQKLFRLYHGHDWEDACHQCDPRTAEKLRKYSEKAKTKKQ